MGLARLAGAVVKKHGGKLVRGVLKAGRKGFPGAGRRRRGLPSLSVSEMGKLMLMKQIVGRNSPAMTIMVMKAMRGRL